MFTVQPIAIPAWKLTGNRCYTYITGPAGVRPDPHLLPADHIEGRFRRMVSRTTLHSSSSVLPLGISYSRPAHAWQESAEQQEPMDYKILAAYPMVILLPGVEVSIARMPHNVRRWNEVWHFCSTHLIGISPVNILMQLNSRRRQHEIVICVQRWKIRRR